MATPLHDPRSSSSHRALPPLSAVARHMRRTFAAGILVMLPIGITILILKFVFELVDGILRSPLALLPGPDIPGQGLAVLVIIVYTMGLIAAHVVGRRLIGIGHRVLEVIPVVKTIYGTTRSAVELLSNSNQGNNRYTEVVLVDFPRPGIQSIGLVTSRMVDADGAEIVAVYIPTTPIPSSGFLLMAPAHELTPTDISVDDALKIIISGGILAGRVFNKCGMPGKESVTLHR